jgi:DNA-binding transcriptional MerR regulator
MELSDRGESASRRGAKSPAAFRTISEVASELDMPQHVLRFWETKFPQVKPLKRGGGRRYYRPEDVELLRRIRRLLYGEGYTIKGVQKILREAGRSPVSPAPFAPPLPERRPSDVSNLGLAQALPPEHKQRLEKILDQLLAIKSLLQELKKK